ncbi:DNA cytosine methyltransferase [Nocardia sp. NPDC056100]|uniref:DNA cytosine methyltransferase n=1 Tax=Nocardia sp. NPDC056100 TaxID=3345712 RepID=UPI0035D6BF1B
MHSFYEFFAGGGMAREGLARSGKWECLFANDFDAKKAASYKSNLPDGEGGAMVVADVAKLSVDEHLATGHADLAWASFPCQDLSLAGSGAGLKGARSGTVHSFWKLIKELREQQRAPRLVVLENVVGALTAGKGQDFVTLGNMLAESGYRFGAVVINAEHWVPQSRPRLFIIAAHRELPIDGLVSEHPTRWHPVSLVAAHSRLLAGSKATRKDDAWVWWNLPEPPSRRTKYQTLADVIEPGDPASVEWHDEAVTKRLLSEELMNAGNRKKFEDAKRRAKATSDTVVGTIYKRMRPEGPLTGKKDKDGKPLREKVQRAEVRFDDIAGCLRTPGGGSSRQTILVIDKNGNRVRSRLLSTREAARLMGLRDDYILPDKYNDAYHLAGDGVVVDVVHFLAENVLEPLLEPLASTDIRRAGAKATQSQLEIKYGDEKVPACV